MTNTKTCAVSPIRRWWNPWTWSTPSRAQYEAVERDAAELAIQLPVLAMAYGYSPPHNMPPYGGACWMEAYAERMAWMQLALAASTYTAAETSYSVKWNAMEACLHGYPV